MERTFSQNDYRNWAPGFHPCSDWPLEQRLQFPLLPESKNVGTKAAGSNGFRHGETAAERVSDASGKYE